MRVAVATLCALWVASVAAQTPVSGAITVNTTWTAEHSPYQVASDLVVENGAILRIQPGTTVLMAAETSLIIHEGGLIAVGRSDERITITSEHDADGSGGSPSPGDWGALVFRNGTIDTVSVLENVDIRYGHGISIERASPTLRNLTIDHHAGAAISQDLHSSPFGSGLSATGNELNGILVPAGRIDDDVVWALKGIPYVIAEGDLSIGMADLELEPAQLALWPEQTAQLVVSLPDPASSDVRVDIVSTHPSVVSLEDVEFIVVPAGERQQAFAIRAVGLGAAQVVVSADGMGISQAEVVVSPAPRIDLEPSSVTLPENQSAVLTVTLNELAGDGGIEVALSSSPEGVVQHSGSVTVPAGETSVNFEVLATEEGAAVIEAAATGFISGQAHLTIVPPNSIYLPDHLVVAPGTARNLRVELSTPAPSGGLEIGVVIGDTGVATAPASLHIQEGDRFGDIRIDGVVLGETSVTVSAPHYGSASTQIVVAEIWIGFDSCPPLLEWSCDIVLPEGAYELLHLRLSEPAPIGGIQIAVSTSTPEAISVSPETVFIAEGQMESQQPVRIEGLAQGESGVVHADADGFQSGQLSINVVGPARLELSRDRIALGRGLTIADYDYYVGFVYESGYGGEHRGSVGGQGFITHYDRTIQIALLGDGVGAPMEVVVPAGGAHAPIRLRGLQLTTASVELIVSAEGYAPVQALVDVVPAELEFLGLAGARGVDSEVDEFNVAWRPVEQPGGNGALQQYGIEDTTIFLSILDEDPAGMVVDAILQNQIPIVQVTLQAGHRGSQSLHVAPPSGEGEYRVGASIVGPHGGTWVSSLQVVSSPYLRILRPWSENEYALDVGAGMRTSHLSETDVVVERVVGRADVGFVPYKAISNVVVQLHSSDVEQLFVAIPDEVTILSETTRVGLRVDGRAVTSSLIEISAVESSHEVYHTPLSVSVVPMALQLIGLEGLRSKFSGRDGFRIELAPVMQRDGSLMRQVPTDSISVDLAIVDADPPGILTDFYSSASSGTTVVTRTISELSYQSVQTWVGRPQSDIGSYKVRATRQDVPSIYVESDLQEVRRPRLRVRRDVPDSQAHLLNVGLGMTAGPNYGSSNRIVVERLLNGSRLVSPDPSVVSLHHDGAGILNATSGSMGSNTAVAQVTVSGLALTLTGHSVAITATADGHEPDEQPLLVSVVPSPGIEILHLDHYRSLSSIRDDFRVATIPVTQEGSYWSMSQGLTDAHDLTISVVDPEPSSVVDGIYESEEGGAPVSVVEFPTEFANWAQLYVGEPSTTGTYQVAAQVAAELVGWPPMVATSEVQTVLPQDAPAAVEFNVDNVKLGSGLMSDEDEVFVRHIGGRSASERSSERQVALACSSSSVCAVANDVRMAAGEERSTSIRLVGAGIGRAKLQVVSSDVRHRNMGVNVDTVAASLDAQASPARVAVSNAFELQVRTGFWNGRLFMHRRPAEPLEVDVISDNPRVLSIVKKAVIEPTTGTIALHGSARAAGTARITVSARGLDPVVVTVQVVN